MIDSIIHPTAIIAKEAEIDEGVHIGPFSIIGPDVKIGAGTWIDSNVVIEGHTKIGSNNKIWRFASLGTRPQDLKYKGEDAELIIGNNNMIREYVNMSIGTEHGGMKTVVGSDSLFMVNVHVGHDSVVGDKCILANGVSLAGHVELGDHVYMAGHSAIHQFCKMGAYSMAAGGAIITQDVPPWVTVHGNRAAPVGFNVVLMKRLGFDPTQIDAVKKAYKILYRSNLSLEESLVQIAELPVEDIKDTMLSFLKDCPRGICR